MIALNSLTRMDAEELASEIRPVARAATAAGRLETPRPPPGPPRLVSRSLTHLAGKGKSATPLGRRVPVISPFKLVMGDDDRTRIHDTKLEPWNMICALHITGSNGRDTTGTGWLVGPKTLLTAGHCVHDQDALGGWASQIEIVPGRNGNTFPFGQAMSRRFSTVDRWVQQQEADFDIGCIHLRQPLHPALGWFPLAVLTPQELEGALVNIAGYPVNPGSGTEQYHHRNRVLRVTDRRVFYDVDTSRGQSGAPVWIHETNMSAPLAVGIHAYGPAGTPSDMNMTANSAPRLIPEVFDLITHWVHGDGGWPAG